jgi:hypothetical protein
MNNSSYTTYLNATKVFLSTEPTIDSMIHYANRLQIDPINDYTCLHTSKPANIMTDWGANLFLPEEYNHFVCGQASADGSCLYNSASIILCGDESLCLVLRAGTVSELMKHAKYYLQLELFQKDWAWSDEAMRTSFQRSEDIYVKAGYYKAEIMESCSTDSYSPLLAIYGLSGFIQHPIYSIFPKISEGSTLRTTYNRKILPRSNSTNITDRSPLHIMWVNVGIETKTDFDKWCKQMFPRTNHFVPVFNQPSITESITSLAMPSTEQPQSSSSSKQNNYVGALMAGIDPTLQLNAETDDEHITYEPAKDTLCLLTRREMLEKLVYFDHIRDIYLWRDWSISHTWLINILQKEPNFPTQLAPVINYTRDNNTALTKYFSCAGCVGSVKASGKFSISIKELLIKNLYVQLKITFSKNRCICTHLKGITYGQTRGLSKQLLKPETTLPRQMRATALAELTPERILTGNRQHVPTAKAAKQLRYSVNPSKDYSIAERFIDAIQKINEKEKADFIKRNGNDAAQNRQLTGHIQAPLQLDPLAINIYNEASLRYYHHLARNNPGVFIDYTGLMIRLVNLLHTHVYIYIYILTYLHVVALIVTCSNSYERNPRNLKRKQRKF